MNYFHVSSSEHNTELRVYPVCLMPVYLNEVWVDLAGRPVQLLQAKFFYTFDGHTAAASIRKRVHQKMVKSCRRARYSG